MSEKETPKPEFDLRQGPWSVRLSTYGEIRATMHTSGRTLETEVKHYDSHGSGGNKDPFSTLDFTCNGARFELFLSDAQLEALADQLGNEIALRRRGGDLEPCEHCDCWTDHGDACCECGDVK